MKDQAEAFDRLWRLLWEKPAYSTGAMVLVTILCVIAWLLPHTEPGHFLHPWRWGLSFVLLALLVFKWAHWHHDVRPQWWADVSAPGRLRNLTEKERALLSFFVSVDRQTLWLPLEDSAVADLRRKGLLELQGVISRQGCSPHQIPDRVWDHLRYRWKGRVAGEELQARPGGLQDWMTLIAIQEEHERR